MYYLYVKTHNVTRLKYLGRTIRNDYHKYKGSGTYWKSHIKIHGYDVTTELLGTYTDLESLKLAGLHYSRLWNIVQSDQWANLCEEDGVGPSSLLIQDWMITTPDNQSLTIRNLAEYCRNHNLHQSAMLKLANRQSPYQPISVLSAQRFKDTHKGYRCNRLPNSLTS